MPGQFIHPYFYLVVDDDGALMSDGYDSEAAAKADGDAVFKAHRDAHKEQNG